MNDAIDPAWEDEIRVGLRAARHAPASVEAPPWGVIRRRGQRRAHRRRTAVVAGVGAVGTFGVAAAVFADHRDPQRSVTKLDVGSAPIAGTATTVPAGPSGWTPDVWMRTMTAPIPAECAGYQAAHPRARALDVDGLADLGSGPTIGETVPTLPPYPSGAHSEQRPEDGQGRRRIVGDDGRVLHEMPVGSLDSLTVDVIEANGWVYYGVVSYTSGETLIVRTSADGATTEDLATLGQYATFVLSPDGRSLLMASLEGTPTIVVRDLAAGTQHVITMAGANFARIKAVAWDPDSEHVLAQVASDAFMVDCRTGDVAQRVGATEDEVRANTRFWVTDPVELRVYRLSTDATTTADATLIREG